MIPVAPRIFTAIALAAIIGGALPRTVCAAVPPSVAVREQPAAVEQIIQQMEAKAAAADGTWTTRSGRQDAPAQTWETGIAGKRWYWKSKAEAPAPEAGLTLFFDGEDAYVLPYGKDNSQGGIRFQYDTLRRWQTADYLLSHYLLHMNLQPRQFIGALGGLSVVGEEQLEGTKVIHLKAEPKADELAKNDPAISHQLRTRQEPSLHLYYSAEKRAIIKLMIGDPTRESHLEVAVTAWKKLSAQEDWPSKLVGKQIIVQGGKTRSLDSPELLSVDRFVQGKDVAVEAINDMVNKEGFFITPYNALRTASLYKKSLTVQENLSDRVALAEASFFAADMVEGLKQWDLVDARLSNAPSRERLENALSELGAATLEQAARDKNQRNACVALIKRLTDTASDVLFRKIANGIMPAWKQLRRSADSARAVEVLNTSLIPRLAGLGSVLVVQDLIGLAEANKQDASLIDPILANVAAAPVPHRGFVGSQQNYLVVAAIRAQALGRANRYLNSLTWLPESTDSEKHMATLWGKTVRVVEDLWRDRDKSLESAIGLYQVFSKEPVSDDVLNSTYGKAALTAAAEKFLLKRLQKGGTENLIFESAKIEGAAAFWTPVLIKIAGEYAAQPQWLSQRFAPLLRAYEKAFGVSGFESHIWLRLSQSRGIAGEFLGVELSYLNKALVSAKDDMARVGVIKQIARTYSVANEFGKGGLAVEALADLVTNPEQKDEIRKIAAKLQSKGATSSDNRKTAP